MQKERIGYANGTDVLGALRLCPTYFLPDYRNMIIMLTDMQQATNTKGLNFERQLNSEKDIDLTLKKTEKINLHNMEVFVLTGRQTTITPQKLNAIKGFWQKYFGQNSAQLVDYSTGSTVLLEQFISNQN